MTEWITAVIGIVSGHIGAFGGALVANWQLRRQKGFERQLDWYERQIAAMHDFAQAIEIGCTFKREGREREFMKKLWRNVQAKLLAFDTVMQQSPLYGSDAANRVITKLESRVNETADLTEAFDLAESSKDELITAVESLAEEIRKRARPLALEAREHLRLG